MKRDAWRRANPRKCACGCGLLIERTRPNCARIWAVGCKRYPEILKAMKNRQMRGKRWRASHGG